jgi:translation elongation factor EF-Ts
MPKFVCSYAHDINCYADFVVEAKNQKAAQRKITQALLDGKFENVDTTPAWENGSTNERVFVQGPADKHSVSTTFEQLTGREHVFSPHTHLCIRCGIHANDDAVENLPCTKT